LTLVAAVAGSEAIEQACGLRADIKWPNDLLLSGRKCCGILSEMQAERDEIRYVIVGIGINVNLNFLTVPDFIKLGFLKVGGNKQAVIVHYRKQCLPGLHQLANLYILFRGDTISRRFYHCVR